LYSLGEEAAVVTGQDIAATAFATYGVLRVGQEDTKTNQKDSKNPRYSMRIQLQRGTDHYTEEAINQTRSIAVIEFANALERFFEKGKQRRFSADRRTLLQARNVPERLEPDFLGAVIRTHIWAASKPPGGEHKTGNVWRELFPRGEPIPYRVDTENSSGVNLVRQF
jgi:hypothetical protein